MQASHDRPRLTRDRQFYQDGNVQLEIRLTGILNLSLLAPGESTGGYGTEVAPQVSCLVCARP